MNYQIGRDGQQLGSFTTEQIIEGLANGTLQSTDLAWTEGMGDWQPVSGLFPAASPPPLAGSPPPPPPPVTRFPAPFPAFSERPQTCGLAIASLVLGILSFLLSCLTAIPAVICGHLALGKIKRSGGTLTGSGLAIGGLIIGYLYVAMIPVLLGIAIPAFTGVQEKARQVQAINGARQVMVGLKVYASDHDGKYPPTLDELFKEGILTDHKVLDYPQFKGWTPDKGYDYSGGSDADPGDKVILMSRSHAENGRRILAHNDATVVIAVPPK